MTQLNVALDGADTYGKQLRDIKFKPMFGFSTANQAINLHKALNIPLILSFMYAYNNFSLPALMYLYAHGTYSLLWLWKYAIYPPKTFEHDVPLWFFVPAFLSPGLYWLTPWILCKTTFDISPVMLLIALSTYQAGIFLHYVSDCQLHYTLLYKEPGLVNTGFFARTRNPGYLGELLIYAGFALLAQHWLPWVVNIFYWTTIFPLQASKKDKSISRHPGWEQYKAQTWQFFPKPWVTPAAADAYVKVAA